MSSSTSALIESIRNGRAGLGAPIMVMAILAMVVLPMPAFALDMFFTFNITLSLIVVLAVVYVLRPLDFGIFPTVLLIATLLRLALNVASTRVVLLEGHTGPDAAGKVIQSFGEFVVGGNYTVGIIVFAILTIINFVVVTKGAGRISEVSARFTLDALPGRQMAIDADLNAGLINADEARARRAEVRAESDFYGSMDGASKFVRGDAVAGILILLINLIGGLLIGTLQHGMAFGDAARVYTLLTIGDGLVAQIPALLLSTSVAIIVTRMSKSNNMGEQVLLQLFGDPRTLGVAAGVLFLMGIIPGMPNQAFLILAAGAGGAAYMTWSRQQKERRKVEPIESTQPSLPDVKELSWEDVAPVDVVGLEVGYRLVPLVDRAQGGELMARIKGVRKKLTQELGFLVQAVHIRDNLELAPNAYRISLHGVPVGESVVHPDRELAINPGRVFGTLEGIKTKDPAFGLESVWIAPGQREHAQTLGYTVVDASTVVATHMSHLLQTHAHELLGHEEVQQLMNALAKVAPKLVDELVPKVLPLATVVKVMQGLLKERIPLRNLRTIVETLAEHAGISQDPAGLLAEVRVAIGRQIVQEINGMETELPVIALEPELERILQDSLQGRAGSPGLEPGLAERIQKGLADCVQRQEAAGSPSVLLVPPGIRATLARFARQALPGLHVLAYNEVPDNKQVRLIATIGD